MRRLRARLLSKAMVFSEGWSSTGLPEASLGIGCEGGSGVVFLSIGNMFLMDGGTLPKVEKKRLSGRFLL